MTGMYRNEKRHGVWTKKEREYVGKQREKTGGERRMCDGQKGKDGRPKLVVKHSTQRKWGERLETKIDGRKEAHMDDYEENDNDKMKKIKLFAKVSNQK